MDALSVLANSIEASGGPGLIVAAGLLARVVVGIEVAAHGLLPTVEFKARLALGLLVALAALPAAFIASPLATAELTLSAALATIAGEACVGLCLGLTVAAAVSAVAWAGEILGSVAGLAWEDGEEDEAAGSSAGVARLARWLSLAGFLAAGGLDIVLVSLIDAVRSMPVGFLSGSATALPPFETWALRMPSMAIGLAVSLAVPALAAVLVFQVVAALALRTASCDPGPGMLHAATALIVLATIFVNAPAWSRAAGPRLLPTLVAAIAAPAPVPSPRSVATPDASSGGHR